MKIIQTDIIQPHELSSWEKDQVYNGLDCCVTSEVLEVLQSQLDNQTASTYAFSKALQGPCLEMRLRGVRIDLHRRDEVVEEFTNQIDHLERNLQRMVGEAFGMWDFNWRSNRDLQELFYDRMGIPVIRKAGKPTVNRAALEKMEVYLIARPIVAHIKTMRDLGKKVAMLKTEIDPDGRIRTSYNIGGTNTGRLSSSFSEFGTGCVRGSAEALTKLGWKQLDQILNGEEIAQFDEGQITFVQCRMYKEKADKLLRYQTTQTSLATTVGHRVLHFRYSAGWKVLSAAEVSTYGSVLIPLGGQLEGGVLEYPAYLAMLMADFTKEGPRRWRGSFKKQRKRERFIELAKEFGFAWEEHTDNREGYKRFSVKTDVEYPKKWGSWILNLTQESASALLKEARYWDSHDRGSGFIFFTVDRDQAEWFATLAHITDKSATIRLGSWHENSFSETRVWCVNVKDRNFAQIKRKHWTWVNNDEEWVYCPQVPSSYWIVRENDKICITGNTNLQNIEESLRSVFIADKGMKLAYFDAEQGESRAVGAIEWNLFHDGRYLDACESGDLHTTVAKICWPDLSWVGDLASDKEIAERPYYRHYSRRFMCKKIGHGTNYAGQPDTISQQAKVPIDIIRDFQPAYFKAFPAHLQWHGWVEKTLKVEGQLTNLTGRRRYFWGRRNDPDTLRAAIAYDPQGSLADIVNSGMLALWRSRICVLLMQIHDAVIVQYPEEVEDEVIPKIVSKLLYRVELRYNRSLEIPYGCKTGWNWGEWSEINPNGLKSYKPRDKRKRIEEVSFLDRSVHSLY